MKKRILKWFAYFLCFMAVFTIVSRILFVVCTPKVTVTDTFSGEIKKSVEASGVVKGSTDLAVVSEAGVKISEVRVKAGEFVEEGDILYTYDTLDISKQIKELNENLQVLDLQIQEAGETQTVVRKQEDAAYRNAVSNLETTEKKQQAAVDAAEKELNARKGAADATAEEIAEAQKAYEDAVSEMEVAVSDARSQVESASIRSASSTTAEQLEITRMQTEEKKKSLEGMLEQDGKKCAECSGYIKEVNISVGNDTTGDADVIVTRMDGGMSVEVTISDTEKQYLSAGEQVQVYKEQDAETAGDCEVLSVEKNADTGAWNVLVDVSGLDVKIGDNVGVQILNESEYYPFLIPREALHYKSGGKYFVYIAEETETVMGTETRAAAQEVEVLDMDDVNVAIERISLQTPVIIDSDRQISEDRRVNCEKNET